MNRCEIYDVKIGGRSRPAVIATRESAIPILANVTLAPITSTIRGLVTEVVVGPQNGLARDSVISCDNLATVPKSVIGKFRGELSPEQSFRFNVALRIALQLD